MAKVLMDKDFELGEPDYQVEVLLSRRLTLFVGDPKSAKSLTSIFLGVCTAGNRDFLGFSTRYGPVYYVNNEHGEEDSHTRWIEKFCLGLGLKPNIPFITSRLLEYPDLTNTSQTDRLLDICVQIGAVLLIVDNLGSSIGGQKEENHVAQKLFTNLVHFNEKGIAVVVIHHFKKNERVYRGPTSIPASVDRVFSFTPTGMRNRQTLDMDGNPTTLSDGTPVMVEVLKEFGFRCEITRGEKPPPLLIGIEENDSTSAAKLVQRGIFTDTSPKEEIKQRVLWFYSADPGVFCSEKDIQDGIGGGDLKDIRDAVRELVLDGKIEYRIHNKKLRLFEVGANVPKIAPISYGENLIKEIMLLREKYILEGAFKIPIGTGFVDPLLSKIPTITSGRVRDELRKLGDEVRTSDNNILFAFLNTNILLSFPNTSVIDKTSI